MKFSSRPVTVTEAQVRALYGAIQKAGWDRAESLPEITVLSDVLREKGYPDAADALTDLAWRIERGYGAANGLPHARGVARAAVARILAGKPPPETQEQRRARLYGYYRRQKLPAKEAFKLAKRAENIGRLVATLSHDEDGGGYVFRQPDGSYSLEWAESWDNGKRFRIYGTDLEREVLPTWIRPDEVGRSLGVSPTYLRRMWRSPRVLERAHARIDVARHYGWENLDSYPLSVSRREAFLRYRRKS